MKTPEAIEKVIARIVATSRRVYCYNPFPVYVDEMERCYDWWMQRIQDAQMRQHA